MTVAARKDDVEPMIEMFEGAGLSLSALDLDLLAQRNAFVFWIKTVQIGRASCRERV